MSTYENLSSRSEPASILELMKSLVLEFRVLLEQHIELGKTELREESGQLKQTLVLFSGAALLGQIGLVFLGLTLMFVLAAYLPVWIAAFALTVLFGVGAAVLFVFAQQAMKRSSSPAPETVQTLQETQDVLSKKL